MAAQDAPSSALIYPANAQTEAASLCQGDSTGAAEPLISINAAFRSCNQCRNTSGGER